MRTLLSAVDILELLEAAADLLGGATLAGVLVDIIRDKPVSLWETAKRARVSRVCRFVLQERWLEKEIGDTGSSRRRDAHRKI